MTREDVIRMAREADLNVHDPAIELLQRFATHVAKHTLANIDPSSFMTWQEGYEAGKQAERARLQAFMRQMFDAYALPSTSVGLRKEPNQE